MKKLTALILALATVCTLCAGVTAAPADTTRLEKTSHINPLYASLFTEEDLTFSPVQPRTAVAEDPVYLESVAQGGKLLREAMKQRQTQYQIYMITEDGSKNALTELSDDLVFYALMHTGVPTEGDYLMWQFLGWTVSAESFQQDSKTFVTFSYELEYFTTAQEEAQVDEKISQIMPQLDLAGKTDYKKLLAIYDYICANVVFDEEHKDQKGYAPQYTAYGALIDGAAIGQGFSVLLYRMALEAGIDCHTMPGTVAGEDHMWNIAQVEDLYYDLDAALDAGKTEYRYFLRGEANFTDHKRESIFDSADVHKLYPMDQNDCCDHQYTSETYDATCAAGGYIAHTCTLCGKSYTSDHTDALPHTFGEWSQTKAPTCTADGELSRTCAVCGGTDTTYISTLGHDYVDGRCTVCDKALQADLTVPDAPVIHSCYSRLQTSVKVTWSLIDGAQGYELWRSTTPDDPASWTRVKTIKTGDTDRYTNQGLTEGVTYYYKVRAYLLDADGERVYSPFSAVDHMPAAVVFDAPYSNSTFRIRLRWNQISGAHGYQIWRKNGDGDFAVAKTIGDRGDQLTNDQGATTAYSNVGLTAGEDYTYKIRAFYITEDGKKIFGTFSDEMTIAVMPETPEIAVASPKAGRATLTWDALYGTEGFQVWMSTSPDRGFAIGKSVTDGTATGAILYGLESGKTYYFKVRAYVEVEGRKTFGAYSETIAITIS